MTDRRCRLQMPPDVLFLAPAYVNFIPWDHTLHWLAILIQTSDRSFDKAEPNSQFRGKYISNNLTRIRVSLICILSGTLDQGATAPRSPFSVPSVLNWICWTPLPRTKFLGTLLIQTVPHWHQTSPKSTVLWRHVFWYTNTDVSGKPTAFVVELHHVHWWWWKRMYLNRRYIYQNTWRQKGSSVFGLVHTWIQSRGTCVSDHVLRLSRYSR
jgi:hypothetical protein